MFEGPMNRFLRGLSSESVWVLVSVLVRFHGVTVPLALFPAGLKNLFWSVGISKLSMGFCRAVGPTE